MTFSRVTLPEGFDPSMPVASLSSEHPFKGHLDKTYSELEKVFKKHKIRFQGQLLTLSAQELFTEKGPISEPLKSDLRIWAIKRHLPSSFLVGLKESLGASRKDNNSPYIFPATENEALGLLAKGYEGLCKPEILQRITQSVSEESIAIKTHPAAEYFYIHLTGDAQVIEKQINDDPGLKSQLVVLFQTISNARRDDPDSLNCSAEAPKGFSLVLTEKGDQAFSRIYTSAASNKIRASMSRALRGPVTEAAQRIVHSPS